MVPGFSTGAFTALHMTAGLIAAAPGLGRSRPAALAA